MDRRFCGTVGYFAWGASIFLISFYLYRNYFSEYFNSNFDEPYFFKEKPVQTRDISNYVRKGCLTFFDNGAIEMHIHAPGDSENFGFYLCEKGDGRLDACGVKLDGIYKVFWTNGEPKDVYIKNKERLFERVCEKVYSERFSTNSKF